MKRVLSILWYRIIGAIFRMFPIKRNRIVFGCFYGKGFGDNPKYIAEELLRRGGYELIWFVKRGLKSDEFPYGIKIVKRGTFSELFYLSTSKVWIDNARKPLGVRKRKKQFYIQTWHSSLRLKKIERDAEKSLDKDYIDAAKNDSSMIDLLVSGCRFSTEIYKNSFWYSGKIIECGTPRCDYLLANNDEECKNRIASRFGIDPKKKIILYAPTFRKNEAEEVYLDCGQLSKKLGNDYVVLVRMHPNTHLDVKQYKRVVNVSNYPDIQELLCGSDFLITDYSGCCFDMMIARKPCVLFVPDIDEYIRSNREMYFSLEELPFKKAKTVSGLVKTIINFDCRGYSSAIEKFCCKIGLKESGNATMEVCNIIENEITIKKKTIVNRMVSFAGKIRFYLVKRILFFNIRNKNIQNLAYREHCYSRLNRRYALIVDKFENRDKLEKPSNKIWFCWLQGLENAPKLVKECYSSLRKNMPNGMELIVLTKDNYSDYVSFPFYIVDKYKKGYICSAHFSDLLRLELLRKYGGLWIDSTVFVSSKINKDFFNNELFVFKNLSLNRNEELSVRASNWLIYSKYPSNNILCLTQKLLYTYWRENNIAVNYHIFHLFFTMASKKFVDDWERVPTFSNIPPHLLQFELNNEFSVERWNQIKSGSSFHKLNHRIKSEDSKSFYSKLICGELENE